MTDYICSKDYKKACCFFTKLCRTITISPPLGRTGKPDNDHHFTIYAKIHHALAGRSSDYILIPEYAGEEERLHFHGVIKFSGNFQLENFMSRSVMKIIQKTIGQIKVDGVPHPRWIEYMFKDNENTQLIQNNYTVIDARDPFVPINIRCSIDDYIFDEDEEGTIDVSQPHHPCPQNKMLIEPFPK